MCLLFWDEVGDSLRRVDGSDGAAALGPGLGAGAGVERGTAPILRLDRQLGAREASGGELGAVFEKW